MTENDGKKFVSSFAAYEIHKALPVTYSFGSKSFWICHWFSQDS